MEHEEELPALKAPAGQAVQEGEPGELKLPAAQRMHVAFEAAPVWADQEPAGQGVGFIEDIGQKEPAGQRMGTPEAQKYEAGQDSLSCGEVPAQKKASHKPTCGASESQSHEPERLSHQQAYLYGYAEMQSAFVVSKSHAVPLIASLRRVAVPSGFAQVPAPPSRPHTNGGSGGLNAPSRNAPFRGLQTPSFTNQPQA